MRLTASDIVSLYRPNLCGLRVYLRQQGVPEAEPSAFDELLRRLGIRHEQEHLATLGPYLSLTGLPEAERIHQTLAAMRQKQPVIYQPTFTGTAALDGHTVQIVGMADFLIADDAGYSIRDSKLSLHIDEEHHPEIVLQLQLYGWLYEQACGRRPAKLQVHSGTGDIVDVHYDGGGAALNVLKTVLRWKTLTSEPYEPVGWSKCGECSFGDRCWQRAEDNRDVAVVRGVNQNVARALHSVGVTCRANLLERFDVESLSQFKVAVGAKASRVGAKAASILANAKVMESGKELVLETPKIPVADNYVMFDLEGMPPHQNDEVKIYLWGAQVFGSRPTGFLPATAGFGPNGDREGWWSFLANCKRLFQQYGDIPFVHWAAYEPAYVNEYIKRYGDPDRVGARVLTNLCDLLKIAEKSVVLPLPSYSLKVIEKYIGFQRTQEEYGGQWSMAMFIEATETEDEQKRADLMEQILKYNEEDLAATWAVLQWLRSKRPTAKAARA